MGKLILAFGHWWPFERGRMRLFHLFFKHPGRRAILNRLPNPVSMRRGFHLWTREDEHTSLWYRLYGCHERATIALLEKELAAGGTFLDIGANLGLFSLTLTRHTPCATVAIEPNPNTAALLRQSITDNGLADRIRVREVALADTAGTLPFLDNRGNAGDSALATDGNAAKAGKRLTVAVVRLDDDAEMQTALAELPPIRAVKMDIQGAEVRALRGMGKTLAKDRPIIVCEMEEDSLREFGSSLEELRATFADLGYEQVGAVDRNGVFRPQA